jgi:hypothetical protein
MRKKLVFLGLVSALSGGAFAGTLSDKMKAAADQGNEAPASSIDYSPKFKALLDSKASAVQASVASTTLAKSDDSASVSGILDSATTYNESATAIAEANKGIDALRQEISSGALSSSSPSVPSYAVTAPWRYDNRGKTISGKLANGAVVQVNAVGDQHRIYKGSSVLQNWNTGFSFAYSLTVASYDPHRDVTTCITTYYNFSLLDGTNNVTGSRYYTANWMNRC